MGKPRTPGEVPATELQLGIEGSHAQNNMRKSDWSALSELWEVRGASCGLGRQHGGGEP